MAAPNFWAFSVLFASNSNQVGLVGCRNGQDSLDKVIWSLGTSEGFSQESIIQNRFYSSLMIVFGSFTTIPFPLIHYSVKPKDKPGPYDEAENP